MKKTVILGNIITVDDRRPFAKAAFVKDGVFAYIGDADEAKKLAGADAKILDYGENFVYPGFLEAHAHGALAGDRAIGQANLSQVRLTDYDKYREIIKDYIAKNPDKEVYVAAGWIQNEEYKTKAYLDEIYSDKPLMMNTIDGHSMLFNTKALEWAGIDAAYAKKYGYDQVHVDENGEPDGYVCEGPLYEIVPKLPRSFDDFKNCLLAWQDIAIQNGFTAVADAGVELLHPSVTQAYHELEEEGKLKMRTYAFMMVPVNAENPKAEVARIAADRAKYSNEYFHIVGVKAFLDGVIEAHTGWQIDDYLDTPGYHGLERFNDHDKMVDLIVAADAEGLSVHVHSIGNGATKFMLDCIEDAEKITGDMDQRNILAHLQFVREEDIRRMAKTGSVPAVFTLWCPKEANIYEQEVRYVGEAIAEKGYPIKSFYDAGANVVFHSDYPVSPLFDIKNSFYVAEARDFPKGIGKVAKPRNMEEAITREQSLRAMTINVARQWRQESRLGSIEFGKIANMTVFDCDFLHDDLEKVAKANVVATIIDGEEVYKAEKNLGGTMMKTNAAEKVVIGDGVMKIIDCEFHYYLPELMEYLSTRNNAPRYYPETKVLEVRDKIYAHLDGVTNTYPIIDELMNFGAERVAEMDRNGIDVGVMSSSPALEELSEKEAVYFAKKSNDAVAEIIKKYPSRFLGAAVLPTPYVDEAIKELERCVKELGFKYWHTHSNYKDEHLYEEKYLPLLAKAEELGCAFYVHPQASDDKDMKDMGYVYSSPGLGFGLDAMKTSLRLILNGTFDKFPNLRMIFGHLGEFFPFIIDRVDNRFEWIKDEEVKMKHKVSYYFKNKNVVVTTSGNMSKPAFECTKKAFGIDSIIFGSDYPYESLSDMMRFMDSLELTAEEKEKVFHLNAEKYILSK